MIISDEEAHQAAKYIQAKRARSESLPSTPEGVPDELVARVRDELARLPETRDDRVASARAHLGEKPRGDEVAAKMLGRLISDSLR